MNRSLLVVSSIACLALACSGAEPAPPAAAGASRGATASPAPAPPGLRLPGGVTPLREAATLTLVPANAVVEGVAELDLRVEQATSLIWLNASDLTVGEAWLEAGGARAVARVVPGGDDYLGFAFEHPVAAGEVHLHVAYRAKVSPSDDRGIFLEKEDGAAYLFSQFENIDARRAFPCFDEPAFKIPWQITLRVEASDVALSNTPIASETTDGRFRVVKFAETKPLPAYLVAFAVGPFEMVDAGKAGKAKTPVRIAAMKGKRADAAYAAASTAKIIDLLEDYFGIPYPYEKMDVVPVPRTLTFGAMENAGLITIAANVALASGPSDTVRFQRGYVDFMAHELAHQWFGDLVTMAWWDDTWLNEAFATWMGSKIVQRYNPAWRFDIDRVESASGAMGEDSLVSARKIRQEIVTNDDIQNAFDGITYEKGATVIGMFEQYLGAEAFRKGIQRYLAKHAFANATGADFLTDLGEGAGKDVKAAFSTFLDQPGVPLVTATASCDKEATRIALKQERYVPIGSTGDPNASLWQIPICVRAGGKTECTLLRERTGEMRLATPGGCAKAVLPKASALGYYRVAYRAADLDALLGRGSDLTSTERVSVIGDVAALVANGRFSIGDALARVPALSQDPDPHVESAVADLAAVRRAYVPSELRPAYAAFVERAFATRARALGFRPKPGESADVHRLRNALVPFVAVSGEDPVLAAEAKELADKWLADPKAIDQDSVPGVLLVAARSGDRALFDRLRAEAKKTSDARRRQRLLLSLGQFREPAILESALGIALTDEFDVRDSLTILLYNGDYDSREVTFGFVEKNYDKLVERMPNEGRSDIVNAAYAFCDAAGKARAEAFFKDRVTKLKGGTRRLRQVLEGISVCIAGKQAEEASLVAFLKKR